MRMQSTRILQGKFEGQEYKQITNSELLMQKYMVWLKKLHNEWVKRMISRLENDQKQYF